MVITIMFNTICENEMSPTNCILRVALTYTNINPIITSERTAHMAKNQYAYKYFGDPSLFADEAMELYIIESKTSPATDDV